MKRAAIIMLALTAICDVARADAQTATQTDEKYYAEATAGVTFKHKVSGSFGAEGGYWFTDTLGLFVEAGRMQNVETGTMADNASLIGGFIGASVEPKRRLTYFNVGVNYRFPNTYYHMQPYVLAGIGAGHVTNETKFSIGGSDVTGTLDSLGVQLGTDLSGSYTKAMFTLGGGIRLPLHARWFGDVSYRYGWVGKNSDAEIEAQNTNRLQFGVGAKF